MINPETMVGMSQSAGLAPSVQMILVILFLLISLATPAVMFLRYVRSNRKADIKDKVEGGLYIHLSEQVNKLTSSQMSIQKEYNEIFRQNSLLEARVSQLEGYENLAKKLQERLEEKDALLSVRENQINLLFADLRDRDNKIINLQERLHALEIKLAIGDIN